MLRNFRSWAILPSTEYVANGANKATLKQCMEFWSGHGTIVVCQKPNGQFHFIAGAGSAEGSKYAEIGSAQECHHDQTGAKFVGPWIVVNEIYYNAATNETRYAVDPVEGVNVPKNFKAPVACFK